MESEALDRDGIELARRRLLDFLPQCRVSAAQYRISQLAEPTSYGLCFAIFIYHLLGQESHISMYREQWILALRSNIDQLRLECLASKRQLITDKPYLQLLSFTLSCYSLLECVKEDPLEDHVVALLEVDMEPVLNRSGVFQGLPRSGNQAMFIGILLLHARMHLGRDTTDKIALWVKLHIDHMNRFGFWGQASSMSHLQFQNGYHQYEIFEYISCPEVSWRECADSVAVLSDSDGNFAPYPGGGACYDYDAAFLLSHDDADFSPRHKLLLFQLASNILSAQNADGGFCESQLIRPRSFAYLEKSVNNIKMVRGIARRERMRQALTLLRPKYNRIATHWSKYSREWSESNLWDSWFRMLAIARIDVATRENAITDWGFIDFPGIGYNKNLIDRVAD